MSKNLPGARSSVLTEYEPISCHGDPIRPQYYIHFCEMCTSEMGTSEMGTSEMGTSEMGTSEMGTSEMGTSETGVI